MTPSALALAVQLATSGPDLGTFRGDVLHGLSLTQKELPSKYFYDDRGSRLFDRICHTPEYYPTRTELTIMHKARGAIAEIIGPKCLLIELGSGSSLKTRILLDHLPNMTGYAPVDISQSYLRRAAADLFLSYPKLEVLPVCADFTRLFSVPQFRSRAARRVVYFPGSTIGNFHPFDAIKLLAMMRELAGLNGGVLIGVDLKKPASILEPAYNDREGVTAAFNLNLLTRINRELGADFDLESFAHRAFYNPGRGRIEMHVQSLRPQTVTVQQQTFDFAAGETIRTECSYKYAVDEFQQLAQKAGLKGSAVWTDDRRLFSVHYVTADAA